MLEAGKVPGDRPAPRLLPVEPAGPRPASKRRCRGGRRRGAPGRAGPAASRRSRSSSSRAASSGRCGRKTSASRPISSTGPTWRSGPSKPAASSWRRRNVEPETAGSARSSADTRGGARASSSGRSRPTCGPGSMLVDRRRDGQAGVGEVARQREAVGDASGPRTSPVRTWIRATTGAGRSQTSRLRLSFRTTGSSTSSPSRATDGDGVGDERGLRRQPEAGRGHDDRPYRLKRISMTSPSRTR